MLLMVPKSGVGRAWESLKMKHEKGSWVLLMVFKSGVGRALGRLQNEA